MRNKTVFKSFLLKAGLVLALTIIPLGTLRSQSTSEEYETITSDSCTECHETSKHNTDFKAALTASVHDGLECLDCHIDKGTLPHKEKTGFFVGCQGCRTCHEQESEEYQGHGYVATGSCEDMPRCSDCHGDHDILPSSNEKSKTFHTNLPFTCGKCHENLNLINKYGIAKDHPLDIYENSIHGIANKEGTSKAATCINCHSLEGTAHKIYSSENPKSSINHFNIEKTCGQCHTKEEKDYLAGIHGQLLEKGDPETPTCSDCHGEHGIISPADPRSPVSKARVAQATCERCHESIALTEKYGLASIRSNKFIDTYHGLKSSSGDTFVANCASCHSYHKILPSSDPESSIYPDNLQKTCGQCHPGITAEIAATPIHEVMEPAKPSKIAQFIKIAYIIIIIAVIGFMLLHWIIDFIRQVILITKKSQVKRMERNEVWQHTLLMLSFTVLVITGFGLRFGDFWLTRILFGWDHGFATRGLIHRGAAAVLIITTLWHILYLMTRKGNQFFKDMLPTPTDIKHLIQRFAFNLGIKKEMPRFERFSYVEKVEYWALIWGTVIMVLTGILLWFDNFFIQFLPKEVLDIALVIHFFEAILASLAILIWHMYSTVFNPHVYPMNPSWLTGKMPKDMFRHEHAGMEIKEEKSSTKDKLWDKTR